MIVAIDPGKTCGLTAISDDGGLIKNFESDPYVTLKYLEDVCKVMRPLVVIIERFTITQRIMSQQTDALEVIGAVRWICWQGGVSLTLQSRADKSRVTNEMLRDLELWAPRTRSPGGHANDATRHAVVYITQRMPRHPIAKRVLGMIRASEPTNGVNDGARGAAGR